MIKVILSDRTYENDIHPLVKAFYPRKEVVITDKDIPKESDISDFIRMDFDKNKISIFADIEGKQYQAATDGPDPVTEKAAYKNALKRLLYKTLSKLSKKELPWGTLTGIRPTKLVYEMLDKGMDEEIIYAIMEKEYLCSREKNRFKHRHS